MNMPPIERDPAIPLRVFLADDHPVVLDGIKARIVADPTLILVGEAREGRSALRQAIDLNPDVAVLDMSMPGLNGIEVARELLAAHPACRVVMLTVNEDYAYLRLLMKLGVAGYVLKRSPSDDLMRGIHAVAEGGIFLDPSMASRVLGMARPRPKEKTGEDSEVTLSAREIEVLRLTAIGHSNKAIAQHMNLGVKSIDTYKARAMAKLGFHNRVDVIRYAMTQGWLDPI